LKDLRTFVLREKREPTTRRKPINLLSLGPAHEQTLYGCALGYKVDQMKGCSHGAGRLRSLTPRDATALLGGYLLLIILVTIVADHRTLRRLNVVSMLSRQVDPSAHDEASSTDHEAFLFVRLSFI